MSQQQQGCYGVKHEEACEIIHGLRRLTEMRILVKEPTNV